MPCRMCKIWMDSFITAMFVIGLLIILCIVMHVSVAPDIIAACERRSGVCPVTTCEAVPFEREKFDEPR